MYAGLSMLISCESEWERVDYMLICQHTHSLFLKPRQIDLAVLHFRLVLGFEGLRHSMNLDFHLRNLLYFPVLREYH